MQNLSVVIPVYKESPEVVARLYNEVKSLGCEVIVVDGGSSDDTCETAAPLCDLLIRSERGRATQMNAGAARASTGLLLFLHADTALPNGALDAIEASTRGAEFAWGRFDVSLDSPRRALRLVAAMMNLRSRVSGIATGDQALFMTRETFQRVNGFAPIALMEDVDMSRRLKRLARPRCLRLKVITSARRWESRGVWRTIFLMWQLRLAFFLGASPDALARRYR